MISVAPDQTWTQHLHSLDVVSVEFVVLNGVGCELAWELSSLHGGQWDDVWQAIYASVDTWLALDAKTKDLLRISAEWDRGWSCPVPCGRDIRCYPAACISEHTIIIAVLDVRKIDYPRRW